MCRRHHANLRRCGDRTGRHPSLEKLQRMMSLMPFGSRKTFRLGRVLSGSLSKRGATSSGRRGLVSTASRTLKLQINLPFGIYAGQRRRRRSRSHRR
jgi:hypothetical protein